MIAKVLINTNVKTLNKVYDYLVPQNLENEIEIGKRVKISFGGGRGRTEEGLVVKLEDEYTGEYKLKEIEEILDEVAYITENKLKLAKWMSYMYFCNVYDTLKLMLPPGTNSVDKNKELKAKTVDVVYLANSVNEIEELIKNIKFRSDKQLQVLKFLIENKEAEVRDIEEGLSVKRAVIKALVDKGYIKIRKDEIESSKLVDLNIKRTEKLVPTDEQKYVIDSISEYIEKKENKSCLLFGVTGSRKNRGIFAINRKSNK